MLNNYNKSSTGVNIELNITYDGDLARQNWEENFISCSEATYIYTDYNNLTVSSFEELFKDNNSTTEESMLDLINDKFDEGVESCSFTELLDWYVFPICMTDLVKDLEVIVKVIMPKY